MTPPIVFIGFTEISHPSSHFRACSCTQIEWVECVRCCTV